MQAASLRHGIVKTYFEGKKNIKYCSSCRGLAYINIKQSFETSVIVYKLKIMKQRSIFDLNNEQEYTWKSKHISFRTTKHWSRNC